MVVAAIARWAKNFENLAAILVSDVVRPIRSLPGPTRTDWLSRRQPADRGARAGGGLGHRDSLIEANTLSPDGISSKTRIRYRWDMVGSKDDERGRRMFCGGRGERPAGARLAVVSDHRERPVDHQSQRERSRWRGAGVGCVPALAARLSPRDRSRPGERLLEPATLGDPMRPLLWVSKSMDKLAASTNTMGIRSRHCDTVRKELKLGFSRQYNRKAEEGWKHPDRNADRPHQCESRDRSGKRSARHLRRYEEEGAGPTASKW